MKSNWRILLAGAGLLMPGMVGLGLHSRSTESALRLLDEREMRFDARGATPVPVNCKLQFRNGNCSDHFSFCASKARADCTGQQCQACSNANKYEQDCPSGKPYNALTCTPQPFIGGGCGTKLDNTTCQWNATFATCQCVGAAGTIDCEQLQATGSGVGSCTVVPP